jgi:3-hydroxyacyl-CoA dehydrogenase/enoyl-CoA hydratase/3-hydroxybutyryl-CoA epimerase
LVKRGQLDHATAHRATGGIGITTDLRDFEDCDIVIEAVAEDVAAKRKLFAELAKIVRPDCLLASNTSALPIEELMADAAGPERALGLHFFNPVIRMPLVELVLGRRTSRTAAAQALDLVGRLGKTPVICRSAPGFYTTRALFFYLNEACRLWEAGVPAAAIDGALREWGWPMGPLRLLDEIGLDVADFILRELAQYYPGRFEPTAVCGRLLAAGMRGRKNGTSAGFYTYADGEAPNPALAAFAPPAAISLSPAAIQERLLGVFVAETERVIAEGVLRGPDDADLALLLGAGFPAWRGGLMHWARGARGTRR